MSDPAYQRTTRAKNRMNKRMYQPVTLVNGTLLTSNGAYRVDASGAVRKIKMKGE